jgi:molecular chaperone GrpE
MSKKDNHEAEQSQVKPEEVRPVADMETVADVQEDADPHKTCEEQRQELVEQLQRLQAEFDNYRKRVEREQADAKSSASEKLLRELLPIVDSFQLSVQHAKDDAGSIKGEDLLAGIMMINEQLAGLLEHQGLTEVPVDRFDPKLHEAINTVAQEGAARGSVLQVYQRGYMRGDRVFRPARVSVAK